MQWRLSLFLYLATLAPVHGAAKNLIIDTDLFSDVDDAAAILLACTNPNINLLGLNINYPSTYTALAASSLLGYYNHAHVPLGLPRPFSNNTFFDTYMYEKGEYASKVAYHWRANASLPWQNVSEANTWDPVRLYRMLLSSVPDEARVTIASIGFLDNLSNLLSSPGDSYSPLPGPDLIRAKVSELVVMGGAYPCGREYNFFGYNATAAAHVVNTWPGRITFSGAELGGDVYSGARLTVDGPVGDPVGAAYRWYNGYNVSRSSWDPLTVVYAMEGLGGLFGFGNEGGHNYVFPDGRNVWRKGEGGGGGERGRLHNYLKLVVPEAQAGNILDGLYLQAAGKVHLQQGAELR